MAAERFTRVFTLPPQQYLAHCPVLLQAGALLKDEFTKRVLGQLRFSSLSEKEISALVSPIVRNGSQITVGADEAVWKAWVEKEARG